VGGLKPTFRTALCEQLGIEYPVFQSGMSRVADSRLVAEVSKAGGLGILAGLALGADRLRAKIREVRALTDLPFGVNLWLHPALRPPADVARLADDRVRTVQGNLNRFRRRLGLPPTFARPAALPDVIEEAFQVVLEERPAVFSVGLGNPEPSRVRECRARGVKVMAMVTSVDEARAVAASGVDIVVAQGLEAGGHRSTWTTPRASNTGIGTMALVPQVVDAVAVPVIASGGIADGRGLVAALALGAAGVLFGTRFVATRESTAPEFWKNALVAGGDGLTVVTEAVTGLPARVLRNVFCDEYGVGGSDVLPPLIQSAAAADIFSAAAQRNDPGYFPMPSGESLGLVRDVPGAAEVVHAIVAEACEVLAALPRRARRA